ncbi:MAG: NAD(P)/FAD-dependent oxidoreductase, partial [Planctomycetaceae bacterium]
TGEYRDGRTFQPITGFKTGMIGKGEVRTDYARPMSYGIRRCEFDQYLLKRSGVPCRLGEAVKTIERRKGRWLINGEIEAKLLIGAGGHFCPVARHLGGREIPGSSVVAAQEIEFQAADEDLRRGSVAPDVPEIFFCEDLQGYGWCFRKESFLNIGLGRLDKEGLSSHVAAFCDWLRERGKIAAAPPQRFHGHAYQIYERVQPRLLDDGVLLIGDAAGLAYPHSGEGIRPAVESGLIAAEIIARAGGRYDAATLSDYERRLTARLGPPRSGGAGDWLPHAALRFLAARLLATRWYARRVVLDGWFLHADLPPLSMS